MPDPSGREEAIALIRDTLCGAVVDAETVRVGRSERHGQVLGAGWRHMVPEESPRLPAGAISQHLLQEAIVRLNPELADRTEVVDGVAATVTGLVVAARDRGLIEARTEMGRWLRGEMRVRVGEANDEVAVRLLSFDDLDENTYPLYTSLRFAVDSEVVEVDVLASVNGIPLALVEVGVGEGRETALQDRLPELFVTVAVTLATDSADPIRSGEAVVEPDEPPEAAAARIAADLLRELQPRTVLAAVAES